MKEKLAKIFESRFQKYADKFYHSYWYIFIVGAICIYAHTLNMPVFGAVLLCVLLAPALLLIKDTMVLVPFVMMCTFVLSQETTPRSGYFDDPTYLAILCSLLAMLVICALINVLYYEKWRVMFKRAYFSVSLALLTAALLAGGMGSKWFTLSGFGMSALLAVSMFLPYALVVNCADYKGRATMNYIACMAVTISVVIFAAVLKQYIIHDLDFNEHPKHFVEFGWGVSNNGAAYVVLTMPFAFYFAYTYKHGYVFLLVAILDVLTVTLTFSRASFVVALPGFIIVTVALCFVKKRGRWLYIAAVAAIAVTAIVLGVVYKDWIIKEFVLTFLNDTSGSGRTVLWKLGFDGWKEYPVFGVGLWFLKQTGHTYFSFHCTPLNYLYCSGVVGFAAYLYHRYKTVQCFFDGKPTPDRVFIALSIAAVLLNALLDTAMTTAQTLLHYGILIAVLELSVNYGKSLEAEKQQTQKNCAALSAQKNYGR